MYWVVSPLKTAMAIPSTPRPISVTWPDIVYSWAIAKILPLVRKNPIQNSMAPRKTVDFILFMAISSRHQIVSRRLRIPTYHIYIKIPPSHSQLKFPCTEEFG